MQRLYHHKIANMKNISIPIIIAFLAVASCTESTVEQVVPLPEAPPNPFDGIVYPTDTAETVAIDSHTFLGLYTYIFSQRCNQPACHDGTFEPDFRTVMSAYHSLVRHPVIKNYDSDPLPFRVSPGDTSQSMMYHRLTRHNPPNFEQMPSSGIPLPADQLSLIAEWIQSGAPDIYGNMPTQSSLQPACYGVVGYLPDFGGFRVDTIRNGIYYNPFLTPVNADLELWFFYLDVTPAGDTIFGNTLTYNKIEFSTNPVDFSNAVELNLGVELIPNLIPSVLSQPLFFPIPYYHKITINPAALGFEVGDLVYLRTFVKDSDHSQPTEIPEDDSQIPLQTYFAFYLVD